MAPKTTKAGTASNSKRGSKKAAAKKAGRGKTKKRTSANSNGRPESAVYLADTHRAVRSELNAAEDLPTFVATAGTLSLQQRRRLVEQAQVLIGDNYVHLPLKRAMHAADPVQALRLLAHQLESTTASNMGPESEFHAEMLRIFASVRDLHTNYLLPAPFASRVAFLPFDAEEYFVDGTRHYQVSHLVPGFTHPTFEEGVELTSWSGVPMDRAVEVNADRFAGSNLAARHARGLQFLTLRPLIQSLPPDENWVEVGYIDLNGQSRSLRHDWMVFDNQNTAGGVDANAMDPGAAALGIDLGLEVATQAKRTLFSPQVVAAAERTPRLSKKAAEVGADVITTLPQVLRARSIDTGSGPVGHLRIFTFNVDDPGGFVAEIERLVGLLPQDKLIVDVRGNGGGHIFASEGLLQLFTPRTISPEPTQFIVTPLNRRICRRHRANPVGIDLGPWTASIEQAIQTSAVYSSGHPITPPEFANGRGQRYRGRVLCITDARCYSATDIFAAGFQDHGIGPVLGVDDNTGAGGANVWTHELLRLLLQHPSPADSQTPYASLPGGANMRVSMRRTLRVHDRSGTPLEDLGVEPDERWLLTRNDLMNGNADLIERAAEMLEAVPLRVLAPVATAVTGDVRPIEVTTNNFGRLDTYVDGRPFGSRNVNEGVTTVEIPADADGVRFEGWSGSDLVVSARLDFP
ncbi:MAG: S41 family peptidase [Acidimicrobiales bacterium]